MIVNANVRLTRPICATLFACLVGLFMPKSFFVSNLAYGPFFFTPKLLFCEVRVADVVRRLCSDSCHAMSPICYNRIIYHLTMFQFRGRYACRYASHCRFSCWNFIRVYTVFRKKHPLLFSCITLR